MISHSILNKRLLCAIMSAIFVSFTAIAQPDFSNKIKTEGSLKDLNISPFSIVRSSATIRGLYDNFVSCVYPDINAHTEEYREWGHGSGPFYKCPDEARFISQVCDLLYVEKQGELWLAAGTPRRWFEAGQNIELKGAYTEYGEVRYTLKQGKESETIEVDI